MISPSSSVIPDRFSCPACAHCGLPVPRSRRLTRADRSPTLEPAQFCCYGCRIVYQLSLAGSDDADAATAPNTLFLRLGLGVFLSMNIMAFSFFFYSQEIYQPDIPPDQQPQFTIIAGLFSYLLLLLCTAVVVTLGTPLAGDAIERFTATGLRWRAIDTNLLIMIGVVSAYTLSAIHTFRGSGELYYDTAAMILVLVTLGHYVDSTARRRATRSAEILIEQMPAQAWRRRGDTVEEIDAGSISIGDAVRVRPGEAAPADGEVLEGRSFVDQSMLTGESQPCAVEPGDTVLAGSVILDGQLWISARSVGNDRVIHLMKHRMEQARQHQPPIQRIADRVAAVFVTGVVVLAIAVFLFHTYQHNASRGLFDGLSVLLISCPCALGLAAPLASWSALGEAQRRGVLIDSGSTLERAASVTSVLFDKTGTLTTGQMTVTRIETAGGCPQDHALAIAAAIEAGSVHPIAKALVAYADQQGVTPKTASHITAMPGVGVQAVIDQKQYRIGSARLLDVCDDNAQAPETSVYLLCGQQQLARFCLVEKIRPDGPDTIRQLKEMGLDVQVLTGDQPGPAQILGDYLHVPVHAQLLPEDKISQLQRTRQERRGLVAMVGDGINDGPILAAADVGVAIATASDLAHRAGNVSLLSERLDRIPIMLSIARHAMRRIRLNLFWAFGYNVIGLTLAAAGYLNPIFAASAMFISSALIVATSSGAGKFQEQAVE